MAGKQLPKISFRKRIDSVLELLEGASLLIMSQPESYRNGTVENPYRQDSFLHYLCGFDEPQSALFIAGHRKAGDQVFLFARPKNHQEEVWTGEREGLSRGKILYDVDHCFPISELEQKVPELLSDTDGLYYKLGYSPENDQRVIKILTNHHARRRRHTASLIPVFDSTSISSLLRLRKSPEEIARLRHAAQITTKAYNRVFSEVCPGMNEKEIHAILISEFLKNGGDMEAYGSIVAGGKNACILHYRNNNQPLHDGDLLLIDAAAQFEYYACDVTRTFPIGKIFSAEQKALYEIVYEAQKQAIQAARPGATLTIVHNTALDVLIDGLIDVQLLQGSRAEILATKSYQRFYPHGTSHWIGLDVHDVGDYMIKGIPRPLEEGMYFSIEPGIYVDPSDHQVPDKFRGIGIRIEDDALITKDGCDILTAAIPKDFKTLCAR